MKNMYTASEEKKGDYHVKSDRDVSLDFLKVIATSFIVFHHYQQLFGVQFSYINFWGGRFYFGHLVQLFFIISGICASKWISCLTVKSFPEFYIKRAMRLLPMVSISVLVASAEMIVYYRLHHEWLQNRVFDIWGGVCACLGIQAGWMIDNPMINNPIWYISVLMLCYLVMYFEVWIAERILIPQEYLFIVTIFVGIGILNYEINVPFFNDYSAWGYMAFFWGLILDLILKYIDKKLKLAKIGALVGMLIIMFFIIHGHTQNIEYISTFFLWPCLILVLRKLLVFDTLGKSIWTILSQRSFGVYIWHGVIMRIYYFLPNAITKHCLNWYAMIGLLFVMWAIGFLSYRFLEKPLLKKLSCVWLR